MLNCNCIFEYQNMLLCILTFSFLLTLLLISKLIPKNQRDTNFQKNRKNYRLYF